MITITLTQMFCLSVTVSLIYKKDEYTIILLLVLIIIIIIMVLMPSVHSIRIVEKLNNCFKKLIFVGVLHRYRGSVVVVNVAERVIIIITNIARTKTKQ